MDGRGRCHELGAWRWTASTSGPSAPSPEFDASIGGTFSLQPALVHSPRNLSKTTGNKAMSGRRPTAAVPRPRNPRPSTKMQPYSDTVRGRQVRSSCRCLRLARHSREGMLGQVPVRWDKVLDNILAAIDANAVGPSLGCLGQDTAFIVPRCQFHGACGHHSLCPVPDMQFSNNAVHMRLHRYSSTCPADTR